MSLYANVNMTHLKIGTVNRAEEENAEGNLTLVVQVVSEMVQKLESREEEMTEAEYEQFLADVWVGVVLTLMVLSCVCCMCSCLLYHKFQQWKRHVLEQRAAAHDPDGRGDTESLPSYTLVSGLPSYAEALEQLKQVRALGQNRDSGVECDKYVGVESTVVSLPDESMSPSGQQTNQMSRLSVAELLQLYKLQQQQQQQQQQQMPQQQMPQQQQQQQQTPTTIPHSGTTKI